MILHRMFIDVCIYSCNKSLYLIYMNMKLVNQAFITKYMFHKCGEFSRYSGASLEQSWIPLKKEIRVNTFRSLWKTYIEFILSWHYIYRWIMFWHLLTKVEISNSNKIGCSLQLILAFSKHNTNEHEKRFFIHFD